MEKGKEHMVPNLLPKKSLPASLGILLNLFRRNIGFWAPFGNVKPNERISRFLFKDNVRADNSIKPNAFRPPRDSSELSVYRTSKLREQTIWRIGKYFVESISRRKNHTKIFGRADLTAKHIVSAFPSLSVKPYRYPHPRHANITNYPIVCSLIMASDPVRAEEQRQRQQDIAKELVHLASRVLLEN